MPVGRLERAVQARDRFVGGDQLLEPGDVRDRGARHPVGPVARRERALVALEQLDPVLLAVLVDQRLAELVGPGADHLGEAGLDRPHVVAGDRVVAEADDVVDAREARLAQLERPVERHPAERLEQDPADPLAVLGVEAVARDAHQALHEPLERVSPQEQPQPLALAEAEDPDRQVVQLLGLHLEQRVARVGLEDLEQRLAVVACRREPGRARAPLRPCRG